MQRRHLPVFEHEQCHRNAAAKGRQPKGWQRTFGIYDAAHYALATHWDALHPHALNRGLQARLQTFDAFLQPGQTPHKSYLLAVFLRRQSR